MEEERYGMNETDNNISGNAGNQTQEPDNDKEQPLNQAESAVTDNQGAQPVNQNQASAERPESNQPYGQPAGGQPNGQGYNYNYNNNRDNYNNGYNNYGNNNYGSNGGNPYNNNYSDYNNNNGRKRGNGSGKKKIAIAACVVVILGVVGMAGTMFVQTMNYIGSYKKDGDSDKIAWEQNDKNDDAEVSPTMEPVSVVEASNVNSGNADVSGVVEAVMPSVVSIISTTSVEGYSIFGQRYSQEISSGGSGFIVGENNEELLITTNNHVVENATAIQVSFIDESTAEAVVKGNDAMADIAVIAVKKEDIDETTRKAIKIATLGDSDSLRIGEVAIVIGNAHGLGQSATVGHISAKDREIDMRGSGLASDTMTYIQTDAAINGGNSGGPLVDINGNVVGISSAKIVDASVEGVCFAIPITLATPIINDLMNRETLEEGERGYLGVILKDISQDAVKMYNVPDGVYVSDVVSGCGADKAGIKAGDIITEINSVKVNSRAAANDKINSYRAGTDIDLVIYRQSESGNGYEAMNVTATLMTAEEVGITSPNDGSDKNKKEDDGGDDGNNYDDIESWFNDLFR